jgi:hypothetical protein
MMEVQVMTITQATAEVFWTAYRALKKKERVAVVQRLLQDSDMREDLRYAMIVEDRKREPTISLDDYLSQRARKKN